MKKILLILITSLISIFGYSQQKEKQEKDIPTPIKTTLLNEYPSVKNIKWYADTINSGDYNACFKLDKYNYTITINANANIVRKDVDIDVAALPSAIMTYINENFPKAQIKKSKRTDIITNPKGTILYTVEIDKKSTPLVFDANGNIVQ